MPVTIAIDGQLDATDIDAVHVQKDHGTGQYLLIVDFRAGKEHRQARAVVDGENVAVCAEVYGAAVAVAQAGLATLSE